MVLNSFEELQRKVSNISKDELIKSYVKILKNIV